MPAQWASQTLGQTSSADPLSTHQGWSASEWLVGSGTGHLRRTLLSSAKCMVAVVQHLLFDDGRLAALRLQPGVYD